jgi:hypothetical protein
MGRGVGLDQIPESCEQDLDRSLEFGVRAAGVHQSVQQVAKRPIVAATAATPKASQRRLTAAVVSRSAAVTSSAGLGGSPARAFREFARRSRVMTSGACDWEGVPIRSPARVR